MFQISFSAYRSFQVVSKQTSRKDRRSPKTKRGGSKEGNAPKGKSPKEWKTLGTAHFIKIRKGLPTNFSRSVDETNDGDEDVLPYIDFWLQRQDKSGSEGCRTRSRAAKASAYMALVDHHFMVFSSAVKLEFNEEVRQSEERLKSWTRDRLKKAGVAFFNMTAYSNGLLFRDAVIRLFPARGPLPYHTFSAGDAVLLSKGEPSDASVEGLVVDFSTKWIRIAMSSNMAVEVQGSGWRIDQYAKTTTFQRCMGALSEVKTRLPEDGEDGNIRRWFLGSISKDSTMDSVVQLAPRWMRGKEGQARLKEARRDATRLLGLNSSQRKAIQKALGQTITLWQGPPGTGKTYTLCAFVSILVSHLPPKHQILVIASSNVAVDNMVGGLVDRKISVVRVGQPVKVTPAVRDATLEAKLAKDPLGKKAAQIRANALELKGPKRAAEWRRADEMENEATSKMLDKAEVIATTCVSTGDPRLEGRIFPVCVLDEATQSAEPESLIGLLRGVQSAVFVGDPQQLPPTVKCLEAKDKGLDISLFERLQRMGVVPHVLDTQYRMHPFIVDFSSVSFYRGLLKSGVSERDRLPVSGVQWPNPKKPVVFIDIQGQEERTTTSNETETAFSFFNVEQADAVVKVVRSILKSEDGPGPSEVGVISPYSGQVRLLRKEFKALSLANIDLLEISTVDGFQGREKDVIVFSTVRCNDRREVGFLSDHRRLNVALTRARRGVIVFGNRETLRADRTWRAWLDWVERNGVGAW